MAILITIIITIIVTPSSPRVVVRTPVLLLQQLRNLVPSSLRMMILIIIIVILILILIVIMITEAKSKKGM